MTKPKVLVLIGYGINCDGETKYAFQRAGAEAERVHINQILQGDRNLSDYQILALPGGFLHGDDIGAGKVLSVLIKNTVIDDIKDFQNKGKPIIGICNGFQVLVKSGLLPGLNDNYEQDVTLDYNDSGRFEDRWVHLDVKDDKCIWTKDVKRLYLPVRHGEGKFVASEDVLLKLYDDGLVVARYVGERGENNPGYPCNPNGSEDDIAGICDPAGRVFGLMPHPEAYIHPTNHPTWTRLKRDGNLPEEGEGLQIFRNGVNYAKGL